MCDCYCASKDLYRDSKRTYKLKSPENSQQKFFNCERETEGFYNPHKTNKFTKIFENVLESGSITYPSEIEEIEFEDLLSNPLYFYKEFVAKNRPCKILNAVDSWNAMEKWQDLDYLKGKMQENTQEITVDITPDGFADSVHGKYFAQPFQKRMSFAEFLKIEEERDLQSFVPYIQKQNGNLTEEFAFLKEDMDPFLCDFGAKHFFDGAPDAVNFWLGYENSVSALHKDHYENFYTVVCGEKHFTLAPPEVYPFLGLSEFTNGYWDFDEKSGEFALELQTQQLNNNNQSTVQWNGFNVDLDLDCQQFPFLKQIPKYHVVVKPGEVLYLPAIWFHQVAQAKNKQSGANHDFTIAVNFWYDMLFDQKYRCMQMLQELTQLDRQEK